MRKFLKIILGIVILFLLIGAGGVFYLSRGLATGAKVEVSGVNLNSLQDGTYTGSYEGGRWSNEVKVTIKDHKIVDIKLVKDVSIPKDEATKELFDRVIKEQNTAADVVSGATVTSKAYLKAIENSLKK